MNSAQTVLKGAELVLSTISGHGVAEALHIAQCRTCTASSELGEDDIRPPAVWAVQHTQADPKHRHYVMTTRKRWRVDPHPIATPQSVPVAVGTSEPGPLGAGSARPQYQRTHHASPSLTRRFLNLIADRPAWVWVRWTVTGIRHVWSWVLPIAGPLFLASMSAALGFFVGAIFAQGRG
jgi:hypothetical protein